jgi:hypothetical protein
MAGWVYDSHICALTVAPTRDPSPATVEHYQLLFTDINPLFASREILFEP